MTEQSQAALPPYLTQDELVSISLKYPEINFDSVVQPESSPHRQTKDNKKQEASPQDKTAIQASHSSPLSQHEDHDTDESRITCSTAQTTPLKHLMFRDNTQQRNVYANYLNYVHDSDLPDTTKSYLRSLASQMIRVGIRLRVVYYQGTEDGHDGNLLNDLARLNSLLHCSIRNCSDQTSTIKWLCELANFAIVPTDIALWTMYRQRSALVTKYLSTPSITEYRLITSLVHVHNAYVHHDFIHHIRQNPDYRPSFADAVHALSSNIHSFLTAYKEWLQTMICFRNTYLTPLLRRIQESTWVRREIEQSELSIEMAKTSLAQRYSSGEIARVLHEDQVRGAEMLADRRSRSSVLPESASTVGEQTADMARKLVREERKKDRGKNKISTRYRREHTL